eukprot:scaffold441599_cov45-Prasinocladus_malaysianus.AAC.1
MHVTSGAQVPPYIHTFHQAQHCDCCRARSPYPEPPPPDQWPPPPRPAAAAAAPWPRIPPYWQPTGHLWKGMTYNCHFTVPNLAYGLTAIPQHSYCCRDVSPCIFYIIFCIHSNRLRFELTPLHYEDPVISFGGGCSVIFETHCQVGYSGMDVNGSQGTNKCMVAG